MSIWAHILVQNEERYIWYAVMSVIDNVDKILIWDTGSNDNTVFIVQEIKKIKGEKVEFRKMDKVGVEKFTDVRQSMLDATDSDWFIIVDGDEVWWEDSIKSLVTEIKTKGKRLDSIVVPYYNVVGDIYHHQNDDIGRYEIDGRRGFLTVRAVNRSVPGLHFEKPHGRQGLYDQNGILLQNRQQKYRKFLNYPYLHFTNVVRSNTRESDLMVPKRKIKLKYEIGVPFPSDFYYPEVFFRPRPDIVPSPWKMSSASYKTRAVIESPLKFVKRRFLQQASASGY